MCKAETKFVIIKEAKSHGPNSNIKSSPTVPEFSVVYADKNLSFKDICFGSYSSYGELSIQISALVLWRHWTDLFHTFRHWCHVVLH